MTNLLFIYGTLRVGHDSPMAKWLRSVARPCGKAVAQGTLYHVGDNYPGFVLEAQGQVIGDLFVMADSGAILATLDDYEECAHHFPQPQEYRREKIIVQSDQGAVSAWTYIYARDVRGLRVIEGGDFLT